jgi:hypothetical protein
MKAKVSMLMGMSLWAFSPATAAELVRIHVGQPLARFSMLQPGAHRYLRYTVGPDGQRNAVDIWERRISFAPAPDGKAGMHIVQRWDEVGSKTVLTQDSWFDRGTFKPITHIRHVEKDGKSQLGGYRFAAGKVVGMPDLPDNLRRDFVMLMPEPSYNFEYDMELLQALPLAAGRTFDIPFYDAGIDPKPDRYRFKVAGSSKVRDWDNRLIDCWLVTADYHTGKVVSRFWFDKASQVLVREEAMQPDGKLLVKALLPPESADLKAPS